MRQEFEVSVKKSSPMCFVFKPELYDRGN